MSTRLQALARSGRAEETASEQVAEERCELCSEPLETEHRHLLHAESRELICACRACALLFDNDAAGEDRYKLIGDRCLRLEDFELSEALWEELKIPVDMAFFFHHGDAERTMAFYPSPMGPTESLLELEAWSRLEAANPVLNELAPDVEALLVNRARGARGYWLVPVDDCYRLVALIRTHWKGLGGGTEVWEAVEGFFADLDRRASAAPRSGAGTEMEMR